MTHPSNVLLHALHDYVRVSSVVLRDHREGLNVRPGVKSQLGKTLCIIPAKMVRICIEYGWRLERGIRWGRWRWLQVPLRWMRVTNLAIRLTRWIQRHGGSTQAQSPTMGGEKGCDAARFLRKLLTTLALGLVAQSTLQTRDERDCED